ncbi:MAG: hypothetical protein FWF60_09585, partial [Oscillospiraceae bacterium]|nr:hypothetical protein [Oscillospiraceae bacterium]
MKTATRRAAAQILAAVALCAGIAAALRWYYDVYINWQPQKYPCAAAVLCAGVAALTLVALWARGARGARGYIWRALVSLAAFLAALAGGSAVINNVIGHGSMPAQAIAAALPLCVIQLLILLILLLLGWGKQGGRARRAIAWALSAALLAPAAYAGVLAWRGGRDVALYAMPVKDHRAEEAMKTRPTIYTAEKRAVMRENAQSEPFRAQAQAAIEQADFYLERIDTLYDMVVAEGLPRYYAVGSARDPNSHRCKYCGTD